MRRIAVFMMSATVAVGLMAGPGVATGGNTKRFCRLNLAVDTSPDAPSRRLLNQLRAAAPSEIADTVDEAVTTFQELGEAAFEDPAFQAAIAEMDQYVLDNCGYDTVDVSMQDYSFNGVPSTLKKGVVAFNLTNDGAEVHEMSVVRLKGKTTIDDLLEVPADAPEKAFRKLVQEVPGGGFAFRGTRRRVRVLRRIRRRGREPEEAGPIRRTVLHPRSEPHRMPRRGRRHRTAPLPRGHGGRVRGHDLNALEPLEQCARARLWQHPLDVRGACRRGRRRLARPCR